MKTVYSVGGITLLVITLLICNVILSLAGLFLGMLHLVPVWIILSTIAPLAILSLITVCLLSFPLFKQSGGELSWKAYHDTLTGLVNRNQLEQSLDISIASALRSQQKFAVFFLDIDHFKQINDTLGHDAGDELLRIVGERLKHAIRKTDIAARLGGDEFILVIHGTDTPAIAAVFAEKIINTITRPVSIMGHELVITTSIGISFYPADGTSYTALVKSADLALYTSKKAGRNTYHFCTSTMNDEIRQKNLFKDAIRTALDKKEFYLVYQPKIDTQTHTICGFEALLRWESETLGNVPPAKIIPLTEEMGLINQLGGWITKMAIADANQWKNRLSGRARVALNISARHYFRSDFIQQILSALEELHFPGALLELEIPESLIMQNPDYSFNIIKQLKQADVVVTIDNFGTGFSSITCLHKMAVDYIKIDRKFVSALLTDPEQPTLFSSMIGLAKSLGIRVLAEGVEKRQQYVKLVKMGCDEIQGFYIGTPMRPEKIPAFVASHAQESVNQ